jgi:hypothetical protein
MFVRDNLDAEPALSLDTMDKSDESLAFAMNDSEALVLF